MMIGSLALPARPVTLHTFGNGAARVVTWDSSRVPGRQETTWVPGAVPRNVGFIPRPRATGNHVGIRGRTS